MSNNEYKEKLVAFLDIMGFKNLVNEGFDNALRLNEVITGSVKEDKNNQYDDLEFSVKLFSDCMCISCNYSLKGIKAMLIKLSYMQIYFSVYNIFLRGGFTFDNHFENENMIFSQALIKAYEIETKAIYPRIVVDDKIIEILKSNKFEGYDFFQYVMLAPDNKYFVDYLDFLYIGDLDKIDLLNSHKESIIHQIRLNSGNIHILDKYKWLSEYYNNKVTEFGFRKDINIVSNLYINIDREFPSFNKIIV